jgi:hypothetical protein
MWFSDHQRKSVASGERFVPHHCFLIHPPGQRDHGTADDAGDHQVRILTTTLRGICQILQTNYARLMRNLMGKVLLRFPLATQKYDEQNKQYTVSPVVVYGNGNWSVAFREEHRLVVIETGC